jgi:hypothetical protein
MNKKDILGIQLFNVVVAIMILFALRTHDLREWVIGVFAQDAANVLFYVDIGIFALIGYVCVSAFEVWLYKKIACGLIAKRKFTREQEKEFALDGTDNHITYIFTTNKYAKNMKFKRWTEYIFVTSTLFSVVNVVGGFVSKHQSDQYAFFMICACISALIMICSGILLGAYHCEPDSDAFRVLLFHIYNAVEKKQQNLPKEKHIDIFERLKTQGLCISVSKDGKRFSVIQKATAVRVLSYEIPAISLTGKAGRYARISEKSISELSVQAPKKYIDYVGS